MSLPSTCFAFVTRLPLGSLGKVHPASPDEPVNLRKPVAGDADGAGVVLGGSAADIGAYRRGTAATRWALARYLVGRVIAESVSVTVLIVAVLILALAAVCEWVLHSTVLAVLLALCALLVLVMRAALLAVLRRLTALGRHGHGDKRMHALVGNTRRDVLRELRRVGLPSHMVTLPLLAVRLLGRRRAQTFTQLRAFDVDRAVPPARVDELHLLLGDALVTPRGARFGGT